MEEIHATGTEIGFTCTNNKKPFHHIIQHVNREWTTFFLEYRGEKKDTTFKYIINNHDSGDFSMKNISGEADGCALGGRFDDTHFFQGDIASFESYHQENVSDELQLMPSSLRKLIISNQMVKGSTSSFIYNN